MKPVVQYWHNWKQDSIKLQYRTPVRGHATMLVVDVLLMAGTETRNSRALVDTGPAVPIVFRTGLFAASLLQEALWPVKFMTANGQHLQGGKQGLKLQVCLPVRDSSDYQQWGSRSSLWGYQADLHSTDVILGYPFLRGFGLLVDPVTGCLRCTGTVFLSSQHSTSTGPGCLPLHRMIHLRFQDS